MTNSVPDHCFELLKKHEELIRAAENTNEATTRLRAIDTILFEVLGWDKQYVSVEKHCREVGYADYAMQTEEEHLIMIIEAKKAADVETKKKLGESFIIPKVSLPNGAIGFSLLARECPEADKALRGCLEISVTSSRDAIAVVHEERHTSRRDSAAAWLFIAIAG